MMTAEYEQSLIRRVLAGERDAFEPLVTENQTLVYNLALRMTGSEQDALDMAQEAFIKAYSSLGSFRGDSRFSTWLYRLTANVCTDLLRSRARHPQQSLTETEDDADEGAQSDLPDPTPGPEEQAERSEQRELVRAAIQQLPPEFARILLLRELGGLSYEEIGTQLRLEPGTVKSRLFRARSKLASILLKSGNFSPAGASYGREDG